MLGRDFELTPDDLRQALLDSAGRCAVTGIKFDITGVLNARKRPFHHSLDRIDSTKGYTPTNIRIVCYAANVAMLDWGENVLSEIATGYVLRKYALGKMLLTGQC